LLFIERLRELSKQLPTLVEKTQIFYLIKRICSLFPLSEPFGSEDMPFPPKNLKKRKRGGEGGEERG
jgi:hypothetical protein